MNLINIFWSKYLQKHQKLQTHFLKIFAAQLSFNKIQQFDSDIAFLSVFCVKHS